MSETSTSVFPLVVLVLAVIVALFSIPEVPGVQSATASTPATNNDKHTNRGVAGVRMEFDHESNRKLSKLIQELLTESYLYMFMANVFDRSELALPGFSKLFKEASEREMDNAKFFMSYVNKRGGHVEFMDISAPKFSPSHLENAAPKALDKSLRGQQKIEDRTRTLHTRAIRRGDPHLKHVLEDRLLDQKVDVIKTLQDQITHLGRMGAANRQLGIYLYDKQL